MNWIARMVDRVCAIIGALCFSQFPQFFTQYLHELSGHLGELRYQVGLIEHAALLSHKSVKEWIAKFQESNDPDFMLQGQMLTGMMERLQTFQEAAFALQTATPLSKPWLFMRHADSQVLSETYRSFQMGLSFSLEGLLYALIGLFAGYALFNLFYLLLKKTSSAFRLKRQIN